MKWKKLGEYDEIKANMIKYLLEEKGVPVMLKQADYALPVIFGSGGIYEVLVPEDSFDEAENLVNIFLEGGAANE